MLHTLATDNYRSLRSLRLRLGTLTVITGANGSGKSNVYRALHLLAHGINGELGRALASEECHEIGVGRYSPVKWRVAKDLADALRAYVRSNGGTAIDGVPIQFGA